MNKLQRRMLRSHYRNKMRNCQPVQTHLYLQTIALRLMFHESCNLLKMPTISPWLLYLCVWLSLGVFMYDTKYIWCPRTLPFCVKDTWKGCPISLLILESIIILKCYLSQWPCSRRKTVWRERLDCIWIWFTHWGRIACKYANAKRVWICYDSLRWCRPWRRLHHS